MPRPVNITFSTVKGYLRIVFPKTITTKNYLQVRNRIESELEQKADKVMVDLSKIITMESLFIGLLLHTRRIIKNKGGILYLVKASEKCAERLRALYLDTIFTMYNSEKQVFTEKK